MSSAPHASGPISSKVTATLSAASAPRRPEFSADAELVMAALGRMEAAAQADRSTLGLLRAELAKVEAVIAHAKLSMAWSADAPGDAVERKPVEAAQLLDELEHLVDAMMEIAGRDGAEPLARESEIAPAQAAIDPAKPAALDEVPTVSGVVSGLAADQTEPTSDASPSEGPAAQNGPTVAMLKAMVAALGAAAPIEPQQPSPGASSPSPEGETAATPTADPAGDIAQHESELLTNFERMDARPWPALDVGMAVIFPPSSDGDQQAPAQPAAAASEQSPPNDEPATPTMQITPDRAAGGGLDAEDLLFGPEPEADPAAPLLESAPDPAGTSSGAPEAAPFEASQSEPAAAEAVESPSPQPEAAASPPPAAPPLDPLAALKAMSAEERIALFT